METQVTTYFLEMMDQSWLRPTTYTPADLSVHQVLVPCPELNRFFYTAVGGEWYWLDRLEWAYNQWLNYLKRPEVETWIATVSAIPAGYFELEKQPEGNVELVYFGLLPQFIGQGIGSYLLTAAIKQAWQLDVQRVWVHTCSLDHPKALENYQRQGFRIYKEETTREVLPDQSPGPWPGARG